MRLEQLNKDFYSLISNYSDASRLISKLKYQGELLLLGGAVRDYMDNRYSCLPRDFDIVIKRTCDNLSLDDLLKEFSYTKNRFNGYKVKLHELEFDIWELENTWAFKERKISCLEKDYSYKLQETVFLNIDSIVYNLSTNELYDDKYSHAMKNRILDIVLYENPCKNLNILRSIIFKRKYDMRLSTTLRDLIIEYTIDNKEYLNKLYQLQFTHYNYEKISKPDLNNELEEILMFK